jgi:hypothetical protein
MLKQSSCHLSTTQARHCTNEPFDQLLGKIIVSLLLTRQKTIMEHLSTLSKPQATPALKQLNQAAVVLRAPTNSSVKGQRQVRTISRQCADHAQTIWQTTQWPKSNTYFSLD